MVGRRVSAGKKERKIFFGKGDLITVMKKYVYFNLFSSLECFEKSDERNILSFNPDH